MDPMPPRVLLAEDDVDLRLTLTEVLEAEGFDVVAVADGREALDSLVRSPQAPSALLADARMPRMNGISLAHQVWKDVALRDLPIVLMSGSGKRKLDAEVLARLFGVLTKPVRLDELLSTIRRAVSIERVPKGAAPC
jgi:CheY-like chemotaxis protein